MGLTISSSKTPIIAKPFIKWVGGKRQLLPELELRVPKSIDAYFEPFVGGGAMFFHLAERIGSCYLSDTNSDLIDTYKAIQSNPRGLISELRCHKNTKDHFEYVRGLDRCLDYADSRSFVEKAARFIYLNKTCFNGLYRVNSKGHFNSPFGRYKNPNIVDADNIFACNSVLCRPGVFLDKRSYCETLSDIKNISRTCGSVFVYLDPPYIPISPTSSFTQYSKGGFTVDDHKKLKTFCDTLSELGIKWMQSNSSAELVFSLYQDYFVEKMPVRRNVSASVSGRNVVYETIIRNYGDE